MAKYAGLVGYVTQKETVPGVWASVTIEKKMRGDVIGLSNSFKQEDNVNDDVTLNKRISVVANPYAYANFTSLKYITYLGVKWRVTGIEVQRPRLILSVGGIWNG